MNELVEIFSELKNESSRIGKEDILKKYKDNQLFLDVLKFVYNPYIVTGISTKKMNKKVNQKPTIIFTALNLVMNHLEHNNSGRDEDISNIQEFINNLKLDEEKKLAKQIFTKSLKVGITEKTINKVYGKDTIPSFGVMLAESFEKKEKSLTGEFYITLKLDGNRCVAVVDDDIKFYTRQGRIIEGLSQLAEQFKEFPKGVYDGELLLKNEDNLPSDELFRATQKVVRKDGEKEDLEFYIFDFVTINEFKQGESKRTYTQRRNILDTVVSDFANNSKHIKLLKVLYKGEDKSRISLILNEVERNGFEGVMVNTADGLYKTKRTSDLLKVKSMKSADLFVMGLEEGVGRNEGRLGAVLAEYKGGITKIGSGFTDEQRKYYWNNPDEIVGRIVETQFFEESMDEKTKQKSLRFPVFKTVRADKSIEDVRYE